MLVLLAVSPAAEVKSGTGGAASSPRGTMSDGDISPELEAILCVLQSDRDLLLQFLLSLYEGEDVLQRVDTLTRQCCGFYGYAAPKVRDLFREIHRQIHKRDRKPDQELARQIEEFKYGQNHTWAETDREFGLEPGCAYRRWLRLKKSRNTPPTV
jgi:hypothetical protein